MNPQLYENVLISDYHYNLSSDKIAKYPLSERDESKLLIYRKGEISENIFLNLHKYIESGDLLVFNNTKVINARVLFTKSTGATIEILCLEPFIPSDFYLAFQQKNKCVWKCVVGNLKKWKNSSLSKKYIYNSKEYLFNAKLIENKNTFQLIEFSWDNELNFEEIIKIVGVIPLPPYIKRETELLDNDRYQTIYSKYSGSVAAPTAGLHFTEKVLNKIKSKDISKTELTLHVGAGTFKPVKTDNIAKHEMHSEHVLINKELIQLIISNIDHIVAVGTTSMRALESIYWLGVKIINYNEENEIFNINQWDAYNLQQDILLIDSLKAVLSLFNIKKNEKIELNTKIMIIPGYKFRIVNKLITNFHQPRSTLLLLVSAFIGEDWRKVYDYALKNNFRFLSYGDCSILIR